MPGRLEQRRAVGGAAAGRPAADRRPSRSAAARNACGVCTARSSVALERLGDASPPETRLIVSATGSAGTDPVGALGEAAEHPAQRAPARRADGPRRARARARAGSAPPPARRRPTPPAWRRRGRRSRPCRPPARRRAAVAGSSQPGRHHQHDRVHLRVVVQQLTDGGQEHPPRNPTNAFGRSAPEPRPLSPPPPRSPTSAPATAHAPPSAG